MKEDFKIQLLKWKNEPGTIGQRGVSYTKEGSKEEYIIRLGEFFEYEKERLLAKDKVQKLNASASCKFETCTQSNLEIDSSKDIERLNQFINLISIQFNQAYSDSFHNRLSKFNLGYHFTSL